MATVEIRAFITSAGGPLAAPATTPTIRIRRTDTGVLVVTDDAVTEHGGGWFAYDYTGADPNLDYEWRIDADPGGSGQVTPAERYVTNVAPGADLDATLTGVAAQARVSIVSDSASPAAVKIMAWLERDGHPVTSGLASATVALKNADDSVVISSGAMTGPTVSGVWRRDVSGVTLVDATQMYADVTITDGTGAVRNYRAHPTLG